MVMGDFTFPTTVGAAVLIDSGYKAYSRPRNVAYTGRDSHLNGNGLWVGEAHIEKKALHVPKSCKNLSKFVFRPFAFGQQFGHLIR